MRVETTEKMTAYEQSEIVRLKFGSTATTYSDASWPDSAKGIDDPQSTYALTQTFAKNVFTLTFKDRAGKVGSLAFAMPSNLETFLVDKQPGASKGDPNLYKEWRLVSPVSPTGIFAGAKSKTAPTARLIFHGDGNACTDATQFTRWTLIVKGPNADFRFFGALTPPSP